MKSILARRADPFLQHSPLRPKNIAKKARGYLCPRCDMVLADGVAYDWCPACSAPVDWFDTRKPVWSCPDCSMMINARRRHVPGCDHCDCNLVLAYTPPARRGKTYTPKPRPRKRGRARRRRRPPGTQRLHSATLLQRMRQLVGSGRALAAVYLFSLVPLLLLGLDADLRWSMIGIAGPWILLPVLVGGLLLTAVGASWKELLAVVGNRKTRVVHGLEHATLKLLEQRGAPIAGGQTHNQSFVARFRRNANWHERQQAVRSAAIDAIAAIKSGNHDLAYDRRCGTSFLVAALLLGLLAAAACVVAFFVSLSFAGVIAIFIGFAAVIGLGARPLGLSAQRWLTVSTSFRRAQLEEIKRLPPRDGNARYELRFTVELD